MLPLWYRRQTPGEAPGFYAEISTIILSKAIMSRWFDLWAATIAINAMCVRLGKAGTAGIDGGLVVKVDRSYKPPRESDMVPESFNESIAVDVA